MIVLQSLESQLAQERIEVDHLQGLVAAAKEKSDRDKEALKKATRCEILVLAFLLKRVFKEGLMGLVSVYFINNNMF